MLDLIVTFKNQSAEVEFSDDAVNNWTSGNISSLSLDDTQPANFFFRLSYQGSVIYETTNFNSTPPPTSGDVVVSNINTTPVSTPFNVGVNTDSKGNILPGAYRVDINVWYTEVGTGNIMVDKTTKNFELKYKQEDLCVETKVDCNAKLFSIENKTDTYLYDGTEPTTLTQDIELTPPSDTGASSQQSSTATLYTTDFWTNTNQVDVTVNLGWDLEDNFKLEDILTYHKPVDVNCSETICSLLCCVENLRRKAHRAKTRNRANYEELMNKLSRANSLLSLFRNADYCTNSGIDRNGIVSQVEELTGCSCQDCGCGDNNKSQKVKGSPSVPIQSKQNIKINEQISSATQTYQNNQLIGIAAQDYVVFIDGLVENAQLNSVTGTLTLPFTVTAGADLKIWIIK